MSNGVTEVEATMLLCDAAESVGGKLYILGGGWTQLQHPNVPVNMALAIKLDIPWDKANERIILQAALVTEDGSPVDLGAGPVVAGGNIEVGRPPGTKRGTPLDATLVLNFGNVGLGPGGYVWELEIDGSIVARSPFRVLSRGA